jgi:Tfp pilus assembly protein PilX
MKTIAYTSVQRGVILPIVLVVMMVVTTLVITQVKRATVDERLAGNWSRLVSGETAAESMLRLCEHVVINVERDRWDGKYQSTDFVNSPAWRTPTAQLDPTKIKIFTQDILPPGATGGNCIIENATSELLAIENQGSDYDHSGTAGSGRNSNLRKYRFTTAVTFAEGTAFGGVTYHSQSEVRWMKQ